MHSPENKYIQAIHLTYSKGNCVMAKSFQPTGKYVAELAGVSQSTVSRVLSGNGVEFISQETSISAIPVNRLRANGPK